MQNKWHRSRASFGMWRAYRLIAPYRGFSGEGYWLRWLSVPRYIVECETNGYTGSGRWQALNPSGAQGPAQLLGWGAPYPATTDTERLEYWRTTAYVLDVQGLDAWACS